MRKKDLGSSEGYWGWGGAGVGAPANSAEPQLACLNKTIFFVMTFELFSEGYAQFPEC